MRLAVLSVAALLAFAAIAEANHKENSLYEGEVTTGSGGTVSLDVSPDGSTVDASFSGLGNGSSCTGVGFGTGPVPITNHSFSYLSMNGQVSASGSFGSSFASGGAQVLIEPCTTGSQAWIVDGPDAYFDEAGASTGQGILNDTGEAQTYKQSAKRGDSEQFALRFDNVGELLESYRLKGCESSKGFKVTYKDSGGDETNAVSSGDYLTDTIAPDTAPFELTLKIKAKKSAEKGKTKTCTITQRSDLFVDVLKAKLEVT
jgi:hypothetical protein